MAPAGLFFCGAGCLMDAALHELLTSTVIHQPRLESDAYDGGAYGDPREMRARVVEKVGEIRTPDSRLVATLGYLILGSEAAHVVERDRFYLDAAAIGAEPVSALAVSKPRDLDGTVHHVRVEFA